MSQGNLFDPEDGNRRRDEAIKRVRDNANRDWKQFANTAVAFLAKRKTHFTTDDVWYVLSLRRVNDLTHEPRAMGAIMRSCAGSGLIEATDQHILSKRPECHRRPVRVWRSLIYQG